MVAFGIWLAAVGAGDLVAGIDGTVCSRGRALVGCAVSALVAGGGAILFGMPGKATIALVGVTIGSNVPWLWSRRPSEWSSTRAAAILLGASLATVFMLLAAGAWPDVTDDPVTRWLESLPFEFAEQPRVEWVASFAGLVLFLQATANGLVRLLLRVAGSPPNSEQNLRGGRIIGPLERILIFGLALAGQATAAALVISAKGLLRFPEISREEKTRIHDVTEYFLVGSLGSWLLALAAAAVMTLDPA